MNKVVVVCTRTIPLLPSSGRESTLRFLIDSFGEQGLIYQYQIRSNFEEISLFRLMDMLMKGLLSILMGGALPIQVLLFYRGKYVREILNYIESVNPQSVYLDSVRAGYYSLFIKKKFPNIRLICDFDDLMSRRMEVLGKYNQPISTGYLSKFIPSFLVPALNNGFISNSLKKYEMYCLSKIECSIARKCDAVVLVSQVEAARLSLLVPLANIITIPPPVREIRSFKEIDGIDRFLFVGSDVQLQNRLTIKYLVDLWSRAKPATSLHIFGKQAGCYPSIDGVHFHGFVEDISDVYVSNSIMIAPSFIAGGVKTKVLESFSYGIIVVGNSVTFEGVQADCSGLIFSENNLESLVIEPSLWVSKINDAGKKAYQAILINHSLQNLRKKWQTSIWPSN